MKKSENVYLSIGSNLGDRESNLAQAITALGINYDITDVHSASFYDTEPLYFTEQEYFFIISYFKDLINLVKRDTII